MVFTACLFYLTVTRGVVPRELHTNAVHLPVNRCFREAPAAARDVETSRTNVPAPLTIRHQRGNYNIKGRVHENQAHMLCYLSVIAPYSKAMVYLVLKN